MPGLVNCCHLFRRHPHRVCGEEGFKNRRGKFIVPRFVRAEGCLPVMANYPGMTARLAAMRSAEVVRSGGGISVGLLSTYLVGSDVSHPRRS